MTTTKIRHGIFETNSSSSHSISINESTFLYDSIAPNKDGHIILHGGQFGWAWEKFDDCLTKANYCAVHASHSEDLTRRLKNVIKEHTGAKDVIIVASEDYNHANWSYIDHESLGTCDVAFKSDETLKNFIFNRKSILYTGNDNESAPPNFFDSDEEKMCKEYVLSLEDGDEVMLISAAEKDDKELIVKYLRDLFYRADYIPEKKLSSVYHCDHSKDDLGIDFEKKTWNVYELEYQYDKKGNYIGEKRFNHTDLKWKIEKR